MIILFEKLNIIDKFTFIDYDSFNNKLLKANSVMTGKVQLNAFNQILILEILKKVKMKLTIKKIKIYHPFLMKMKMCILYLVSIMNLLNI